MDVAARPAMPDDLDAVVALAEAAIAELTPNRGGSLWSQFEGRPQPVRDRLADEIADDAVLTAAGAIDGAVVGYAVAAPVTGHDGGRIVRLTDIYVLPEARGVGVGECLMEHTLAWASEQGAGGVDSLALPGDRATKNFFESFGLVARAIVVHRAL